MNNQSEKIVALLGPTNTGKTYVAIEKMLEFNSGIFGLPLRLLAREVYDKCVLKVGVEKVASTLDSLVLDPQLVFTSFSGSLTDNWGFTATYDDQGRLYGGGVAFATGYVSTVGAFQTGYNASTGPFQNFEPDVTISVFEPSGNNLLYASYLGGAKSDHPHSMVVNSNGELIVMGTTGSANFPTQNPIQNSNAGGSTVNVNLIFSAYLF